MLVDFADGEIPSFLTFNASEGNMVEHHGQNVMHLKLKTSANQYSGIALTPEEPWDFRELGNISIAFDAVSKGDHTTQLMLIVSDRHGKAHTRSEVVRSGKMRTYYSILPVEGPTRGADEPRNEFNLGSGMRSEPPMFPTEDIQLAWMWGEKHLDLGGIAGIKLSSMSSPHDKEVLITNLRVVGNPPADEKYLVGIVDAFGQAAKIDFPGKVRSREELQAARDKESKSFKGKAFPGRSKFGGWADGPRFEATGFFRTQKVDGKWSLVDPEGYLYLSMGIDVVRRGDTSTLTGQDVNGEFKHGDTLEDFEMKVVSEIRRNMFEWLPSGDHELAGHYGYAFGVHSGLLKQGVTFDFYGANLQRKYGAGSDQEEWRRVTVNRMVDWGFTSLGNWTDPSFYGNGKIAFVANRSIRGAFKTVSSGNDLWEPLPDPFDPAFADAVVRTVRDVADEVGESPWCAGVFFDNEISFGRPNSRESLYGVVINTLQRDGAEVPTKAAFTRILKETYATVEDLNTAWHCDSPSWEAFDRGMDSSIRTEAQVADYAVLLEAYADQYFKLIGDAMDTCMPHHLYLGSRFADWGMPVEAVRAAARHVDVISFNFYKEGLFPPTWAFLEEIDMPCIIGEFGNGATDGGHYHFGVVAAESQEDRAKKFTDYLGTLLENPYFVGAHWFQYLDSPLTGRTYDGENYNNGFVSVTDTPYQPMVDAARAVTSRMYERRFGKRKITPQDP